MKCSRCGRYPVHPYTPYSVRLGICLHAAMGYDCRRFGRNLRPWMREYLRSH